MFLEFSLILVHTLRACFVCGSSYPPILVHTLGACFVCGSRYPPILVDALGARLARGRPSCQCVGDDYRVDVSDVVVVLVVRGAVHRELAVFLEGPTERRLVRVHHVVAVGRNIQCDDDRNTPPKNNTTKHIGATPLNILLCIYIKYLHIVQII